MARSNLIWWILPSKRVLRLSAYLTCVFLGCGALAARAVYGQAKEAALAFGQQLRGLEELSGSDEVINVNGERLHRASVVRDDTVSQLLDRVQADCENSPGLLGQVVSQAAREHPDHFKKHPLSPRLLRGIVRDDNEQRGMVACFTDERISDLRGFAEAASRFAESSDLSEFGRFRYAFARRGDDGRTVLTLLWADTGLNLSTMFPAVGDAAGDDSRVLPRPKGSRRTLAASAESEPYAIRLYETAEPVSAVQRFYGEWMKQHGWIDAGKADAEGASSYFREDGYQVIIVISEGNGRTSVALTEAGRDRGSIAEVEVQVVK